MFILGKGKTVRYQTSLHGLFYNPYNNKWKIRFSLKTTDCLQSTLNWPSTSLNPPPGWRLYSKHFLSLAGTIYFCIQHVVWACKDSLIEPKTFLVQQVVRATGEGSVTKWSGSLGLYNWVVPGSSRPPYHSLDLFSVAPCSTLWLHFACCRLVCLLPFKIGKFIKNFKKRKYVSSFLVTI